MKDYQKISELVKADLDIIIKGLCAKLNLQEPIHNQVKDFLYAPAKHIRPLLAILYLKACKIELTENHYKLLTAIELVHNASLIHDDVIDNEELRRSRKTLNTIFSPKIAVVAGDYLLACAMDYIRELDNFEILDIFIKTLANMCKGEFTQYFLINKIPDMDEYLCKTEQKTAKLFMAAFEGCAILSKDINRDNAIEFAKNFGIAFQIKDDLSNIVTSNTDVQNGIYTAPIILSGSVDNPAIEKTYTLLNNYIELARVNLKPIEANIYKQALLELTVIYKK